MDRRGFLKSGTALILSVPAAKAAAAGWIPAVAGDGLKTGSGMVKAAGTAKATGRTLRFGMVTDPHFARRRENIGRYYLDSAVKMQQAVDYFRGQDLDFIIELGDFKDMSPAKDPAEALGYLDSIEQVFQSYGGPAYHVLGNHDMDCISKSEFLSRTANPGRAAGRSWYSFARKGVRCIVLDANFKKDLTPYDRGNFSWKSATIPPEQLAWLDAELSSHPRQRTLIFVHQRLDSFSGDDRHYFVLNAAEVVSVLERHPQVLAVFQGHCHEGGYSLRSGIHYWTTPAMVAGEWPLHNSYAVVEVSPDGEIRIQGFKDCPSLPAGRA